MSSTTFRKVRFVLTNLPQIWKDCAKQTLKEEHVGGRNTPGMRIKEKKKKKMGASWWGKLPGSIPAGEWDPPLWVPDPPQGFLGFCPPPPCPAFHQPQEGGGGSLGVSRKKKRKILSSWFNPDGLQNKSISSWDDPSEGGAGRFGVYQNSH